MFVLSSNRPMKKLAAKTSPEGIRAIRKASNCRPPDRYSGPHAEGRQQARLMRDAAERGAGADADGGQHDPRAKVKRLARANKIFPKQRDYRRAFGPELERGAFRFGFSPG